MSEESQQGYPEEARGRRPERRRPALEDSLPRDAAKAPRKHDDQADDADDGKATGNPRSAG